MTLSTLRRRARSAGLTVRVVPAPSRWSAQYGPIVLLDSHTGAVVASRLDLDDALLEVDARR